MPVIVLYRHPGHEQEMMLSLAVINRRAHKRDTSRDVMDGKISIIKDIDLHKPHAAHLRILGSMALSLVSTKYVPSNFNQLYEAWMTVLDVKALNEKFYKELADWYYWAIRSETGVRFPKGQPLDESHDPATTGRPSVAMIRLLTRLIFVWFLKEKRLVPSELFDDKELAKLLSTAPAQQQREGNYYKAVLQNLFFATLNTETNAEDVYFYERSFQLLNPYGVLSFITSNKWFRAKYGADLRRYMASHTEMRQIIDFGDEAVFDALAYPTIVIATKRAESDVLINARNDVLTLNWDSNNSAHQVAHFPDVFAAEHFAVPQSELKAGGWQLEPPTQRRLLERLRKAGQPLGDYCQGQFYYGIKTGLNDAFDISREERDSIVDAHSASAILIKPFLRGKDVKRWNVNFAERYLIKIESSENVKHPWSGLSADLAEKEFAKIHPTIYAWFTAEGRRQKLIDRTDQGHYFWELRYCAYWVDFENPKIILSRFMNQPTYAWDDQGMYLSNGSSMIAGADQYAVAILNSAVAWWFLQATSTDLSGGFLQAHNYNQFSIPIPDAINAQKQTAIAIVEAIRRGLSKTEYERLLNGLVYELFFPEDLHAKGIHLFEACAKAGIADWPALDNAVGENRPDELAQTEWNLSARSTADEIFQPRHPIYGMLFELQAVEVVRIIEGREDAKGDR